MLQWEVCEPSPPNDEPWTIDDLGVGVVGLFFKMELLVEWTMVQ